MPGWIGGLVESFTRHRRPQQSPEDLLRLAIGQDDYEGVKAALPACQHPAGARITHPGYFESFSFAVVAADGGRNRALAALLENPEVRRTIDFQVAKRGLSLEDGRPLSRGSAAHYAARAGNAEGLRLLKEAGADIGLVRQTLQCAFTPLAEAQTQVRLHGETSGFAETISYLKSEGVVAVNSQMNADREPSLTLDS